MTLLFSFGDFGAIILIILGILIFRTLMSFLFNGVSKMTGKTITHRGAVLGKPYNETDKMINEGRIEKAKQELPNIFDNISEKEKERREKEFLRMKAELYPTAHIQLIAKSLLNKIDLTPLPFQNKPSLPNLSIIEKLNLVEKKKSFSKDIEN